MNLNLILVTGLAYTLLGALVLVLSHRTLYRKASNIVAGYPKVLASLQAHRHDARMGVILIACGSILQVLASSGYALPPEFWAYPALLAALVLCIYATNRRLSKRAVARPQTKGAVRAPVLRMYESRRSLVLMEAARREAEIRAARERALALTSGKVVYVAQDWDCRWWSDKLGVTPEALRATVRQVGPMLHDVERHLGVAPKLRAAAAL